MEKKEPLNRIFTNAVHFNLYTKAFNHPAMSVRESKTVSNSGFLVVDSGFQILDSGSFSKGTLIPDSNRLLDSKFLELYSGFQSPGFQIPKEKVSHEYKQRRK